MKETIMINNIRWEVNLVEERELPNFKNDKTTYLGYCYNGDLSIWINKRLKEDMLKFTIKHELVHAYIFSYGFEQVRLDVEVMADFIALYSRSINYHTSVIIELWREIGYNETMVEEELV